MANNIYDLGDKVRAKALFSDAVLQAVIDPDVVKLSVKNPAGNVTTYTYGVSTIQRNATGDYYADLDANAAGTWYYRWWSTGTGQAAEENRFEVKAANAV